MIYSDSMLLAELKLGGLANVPDVLRRGLLKIVPEPDIEDIQPASIDLHLGDELKYYDANQGPLAPDKAPTYDSVTIKGDTLLSPGKFVLGVTEEYIEIPAHAAAMVEGKSSLGRLGLLVHATAGFINPGFKGRLTLELRNLNELPIVLRPGMAVSQLSLYALYGTVQRPYGSKGLGSRYQHSVNLEGMKAKR